jgi:hypothetical protein
MGAETTCPVTFNGKTSTAKVRLETAVLQIRASDLRLDVPFTAMKNVSAHGGVLSMVHGGNALRVALGTSADKWLDKILHPPSRLAKIGVRPAWRTVVVGDVDKAFIEELRAAVDTVSVGRMLKAIDAAFVGVAHPSDFKRLASVKVSIKPDGALWLIRPKGSVHVTEGAVMAAGKAAGFVDVKVVAFSPTHSALKFVIPVKNRPR